MTGATSVPSMPAESVNEVLGAGIAEPVDRHGAFPRLNEEQRARLRPLGTIRAVEPGDVLVRAGDDRYDFFVIESGAVAIVEGYGDENRVIAVHGPHRFLGELNLLTGARPYLTAVVRDAGEVIEIPAELLRALVAGDEEFSDIFLRAFIERRSILIGLGTGHRIVGSHFSPDSRRLREFLARNRVPYQWFDLEEDTEAEQILQALQIDPRDTPVVLVSGGDVLRNPTNAVLAAKLGLGARGAPPAMCDLVIVGGGPAGLAAAVYGASEGLDTQAIDVGRVRRPGGHVLARSRTTSASPPAFPESELAERAQLQARSSAPVWSCPREAVALVREDDHYAIATTAAPSSAAARWSSPPAPATASSTCPTSSASRAPASTTRRRRSRRSSAPATRS